LYLKRMLPCNLHICEDRNSVILVLHIMAVPFVWPLATDS
jgi:hypothetical protein